MKPVENHTLLNQLKWRYATKKFDANRKIPVEDWNTLEQALIASASSYGLQPWHFVVITSQEMKEQLKPISWGQGQVTQCSHVVVFAAKKGMDAQWVQKHLNRISEVRGVPIEKLDGFKNMMLGSISAQDATSVDIWNGRQVYIAMGNLLHSAAMLGIDACPMEGIESGKFDQILGLDKKGFRTLGIVTLGYRASDDVSAHFPKVRFKAEDVVTHIA